MGWQDFTQRVLPFMGADLLLSDLANKLAPNQVYIPTLENGYGGLVIATNAPSNTCAITCQVVDATGIVPTWTARQVVDTVTPAMFVPPYAYSTASALRITLTASVNQTINSTTFIFGMSNLPPSMQGSKPMRADGRDYPVGKNLTAQSTAAGAGATLLAAPGVGIRYLIHGISLTSSGGSAQINATIGGSNTLLLFSVQAGVLYAAPPGGWLCDPNTAVTIVGNVGSTQFAAVTYDVVS